MKTHPRDAQRNDRGADAGAETRLREIALADRARPRRLDGDARARADGFSPARDDAVTARAAPRCSSAWRRARPDAFLEAGPHVVPFTPGGHRHPRARSGRSSPRPGGRFSVVIENKPGAAGNVGVDYVAKSPPDGFAIDRDGHIRPSPRIPRCTTRCPTIRSGTSRRSRRSRRCPTCLVAGPAIWRAALAEFVAYKANLGKVFYGLGNERRISRPSTSRCAPAF